MPGSTVSCDPAFVLPHSVEDAFDAPDITVFERSRMGAPDHHPVDAVILASHRGTPSGEVAVFTPEFADGVIFIGPWGAFPA